MIKEEFLLVLFDILIIILLYQILKKARNNPFRISKIQSELSFLLLLFLCVFSYYDTDWYHYKEWIEAIKIADFVEYGENSNLEPFYIFIAKYLNYEYIPFRLVIWGSALVLFRITANRLSLNKNVVYLFLLPNIIIFTYARVTLAMVSCFWGLSYLIKPMKKSKLLSYIISLLIISFSVDLHKSAFFVVPVFIISLINLKKKHIKFLIPLFFIMVLIITNIVFPYLMNDDSIESNVAIEYLSADVNQKSIGGIVYRTISSFPYYVIFAYLLISIKNKKYISWPYYIKVLSNTYIWTVMIATTFLLNLSMNTNVLFYRFLNYAMIPGIFVLSFLHLKTEQKKINKILSISLCALFYVLIYRLYLFYF